MFRTYINILAIAVMFASLTPINPPAFGQAASPITGKVYHDVTGDGLFNNTPPIVESGVTGVAGRFRASHFY